jgi:hypothetical protein
LALVRGGVGDGHEFITEELVDVPLEWLAIQLLTQGEPGRDVTVPVYKTAVEIVRRRITV